MGEQVECAARFEGNESRGRAMLEPDKLLFRGEFRLSIPLKSVKSADARGGELTVVFPDGTAVFEIGPLAERWALKIRYPRSLMEKLGVKPDSRVSVIGVKDESFWSQLTAQVDDAKSRVRAESDLIFLSVESLKDLERLVTLQDSLKRNGAIWVVAPKGKQHVKESDVIAAGKKAGLVDNKVVSFSDTHTAHRLVIPVRRR
jgi:Protein of unknown function (DUF3052)